MGVGLMLMDRLIKDHHVGECPDCGWVTGVVHNGGAITCVVCDSFITPLSSPYNRKQEAQRK